MKNLAAFRTYLLYERRLAPSTVDRYATVASSFSEHLVAQFGKVRWRRVDRQKVVNFLIAEGGEAKASRPAWNNRVAALRALFDWLASTGQVRANPAQLVLRVSSPPAERVPLSFEEALALVSAVREYSPPGFASRNVALMQVLLHCGLRVSEVAGLDVGQLDVAGHLFLDVVVKGDRRLAARFNDVVAEAIEEYLPERAKLAPADEPALFVSSHRRRWSVRAIEYFVATYAKRAGIKRSVFPHLLRHSSATLLSEVAQTPIEVVQEHLHHRSLATTRHYVHVSAKAHRQAVDRLGEAWKLAVGEQHRNDAEPQNSAESPNEKTA